jgi:hypothetical protein
MHSDTADIKISMEVNISTSVPEMSAWTQQAHFMNNLLPLLLDGESR